MWRHRGHVITRCVFTGDYLVHTGRGADKVEVLRHPGAWGLKQTRADIDAIVDESEKEARAERIREEVARRREAEQAERERLWLRNVPSTQCRKCGAATCDATTEAGQRMALDIDPDPHGSWIVVSQQLRSRQPVIRRATDEPATERYEIHIATCSRRTPSADRTGQYRLRLGRWVHLSEPSHRKSRRPTRQLLLTETARYEQLELPCPSESAPANPVTPASGGQ